MELAAEEVQRQEMFVLLDEQRDAYNTVLHAVAKAWESNTKTAVVVSGGPGSGKSVIALSLFGELARQGRTVIHATGSQSFTTTLRKVAARGAPRVRRAFQYFNSFMSAAPNEIECLILDEAHRIRETSANRFTRATLRTDRPQVDELLSAARVASVGDRPMGPCLELPMAFEPNHRPQTERRITAPSRARPHAHPRAR